MKLKIIILLLVATFSEVYQTKSLDLKGIRDAVSNPESEYFYGTLLKRYNELDPSLTLEDFKYIYYGFSFQGEYVENLYSYLSERSDMIKAQKSGDWKSVKEISSSILQKHPVNLDANYYHMAALNELNPDDSLWNKYKIWWNSLLKVIVNSGTGLTSDSPVVVITIDDEYHMIYAYYKIPKVKSQVCCDHFNVEQGEYFKFDQIYFDISQKLIADSKLFP